MKIMNSNSSFRIPGGVFVNEKQYYDEVYKNNLRMVEKMRAIKRRKPLAKFGLD